MKTKPPTAPVAGEWTRDWRPELSAPGTYWMRERDNPAAGAWILEHATDGSTRVVGSDENYYEDWMHGKYEFLRITPTDAERLVRLEKAARDLLDTLVDKHVADNLFRLGALARGQIVDAADELRSVLEVE